MLKFEIIFPPKFCRIKKTADPCVFCVRRYSPNNYLTFDAHALYFVRPLYVHICMYWAKRPGPPWTICTLRPGVSAASMQPQYPRIKILPFFHHSRDSTRVGSLILNCKTASGPLSYTKSV